MDVSPNSRVDAPATVLASRAREATYGLHRRTSRGAIGTAAEVSEVLAALRQLTDNVSRCLPELTLWLEQRMCAGGLPGPGFDAVTRSVFEAVSALARAQDLTIQLGVEVGAAEAASRELAD
jgi:hypothetical protein